MNNNKFKSENKNISNSKYMKYKAVELFHNSKRPKYAWKKDTSKIRDLELVSFYEYNSTLNLPKNYSILTGKKSNLTVIDIDCNKNENIEDNVFIKKYGSDPSKWDGVVIKSPSGGFHVYYQYEASLKHGQDAVSHVDIRNDNGLIVSAGSFRDGKKYECIHGDLNDIPKIKDDMIDFIHSIDYYNPSKNNSSDRKTKIRLKKIKSKDGTKEIIIEEIIGCDQSLYHYDYPDQLLHHIIKGLPSKYFETYEGFLIFTTAMKQIDRQDIWELYPKLNNPAGGSVDCEEHKMWMLDCWEGITGHKTILAMNHLLINSSYKNARTSLDYFKYKPTLKNKRKPDETVESEKLGYDFFTDRLGKNGIRFITCRSDTGTGKTTSFKTFMKNHPKERCISIVSRISLGLEQYETFNNAGIDTGFYENESFYPGENYIVQIDSLLKLQYWVNQGMTQGYSLFLDEWNSIVKHLFTSDTMTKNGVRIQIMDLLVEIIRDAKYVIMTDADISDQSLRFLDFVLDKQDYRNKDKKLSDYSVFIENDYKHNKGTPAEELFDIDTLARMMKGTKKWICPCDEARSCHLLKEMIGDENILIVDKNTTERHNWDEYDRIIFSPKVIYGLDSIMERPVFCFYQESTIDARDMLQQINRNRNITKLYYLFQRKRCRETDFNTLDDAIEDSNNLKKWCDKNDYLHQEMSSVHSIFKDVFNQLKYNRDALESNPYAHFKKLLQERGFNDTTKIIQSNIKRSKELLKADKQRMISEVHKDIPYVKDNNEKYIGLPEDEIENFKEIFCDNQFIRRYTSLKRYIFYDYGSEYNAEQKKWIQDYKDDEIRLTEQKREMKKDMKEKGEFDIKKIISDQSKIIFLDRLRTDIEMNDRLKINDFKLLDDKKAGEYFKEYQATFGDRSKKEKENPLLSETGTQQFIGKIYKKIFGINPFKGSSTSKDGTTIMKYADAELRDFGVFHEVFTLSKAEYEKNKNTLYETEKLNETCLINDD